MLDRVYFPNLSGLRFIAAFLIIIYHLELVRYNLYYDDCWNIPFINNASLGVTFFFVLSGFLITYLLLFEKKKTKEINIKRFYVRRILRIWPLYYIIIILACFILNDIDFFNIYNKNIVNWTDEKTFIKILILFALILPNIVLFGYGIVPYADQTWSIGVEEQFYLIWPILIKFVKNKYQVVIGTIIIYLLVTQILINFVSYNEFTRKMTSILINFKIDCMAIGGLFALMHFNKNKIIKILNSTLFGWISILVLCTFMAINIHIPYIDNEIYSILFAIIILNLATGKKPIFNLENKILGYLGKISYGLYMYHFIAITIAIKFLFILNIHNYVIQVLTTTLITIAISGLSYHYIEQPFLKLKKKFTKIRSL